jgi:hypothetical protein
VGQESGEGLGALPERKLSELSAQDFNPLAARALAIHPPTWKHAETDHFIYHFIHSYVATPISVEAEFHYRVISQLLGREPQSGAADKSDIYIFEDPADWKTFQESARLEPWTGGIHSLGSLFIVRNPAFKFSDRSLGHELVHLMLFRLYRRPLPRWLDEGLAEYFSKVARASYERARNYHARPRWSSLAGETFIPLRQLTSMDYPAESSQVGVFYGESERLVRYLITRDREHFLTLLNDVGRGVAFDTALGRNYGGYFSDVAVLEQQFLEEAAKDPLAISAE